MDVSIFSWNNWIILFLLKISQRQKLWNKTQFTFYLNEKGLKKIETWSTPRIQQIKRNDD